VKVSAIEPYISFVAMATPAAQRTKSTLLVGEEEFSVGKHIDNIGFGWYQVQAFIFCAGAIWTEGTNLSSISGVKMPIYSEFGITSDLGQSMIMFVLYLGFGIGTGTSGMLGDTRGRRAPMMVGFMGVALCQVALFYMPYLPLIYVLIFALGFFAGFPIPAAVTMMGEVVPSCYRGLTVGALAVGFSMGELTSAVGLRFFVPDLVTGNWRYQLIWAGIPPVILLLLGLVCSATQYDSPQFLASHNCLKDLRAALNLAAEMNGRLDLTLEHDLPGEEGESDVTFAEVRGIMFTGSMGLYTMTLCVMFFTFNWGYYGTVDFWPIGWTLMNLKGIEKATEMIFTALIGFAGVPVCMFTMHNIKRRPGLCVSGLLCFVASICLQGLLTDNITEGVIGVILFKVFWMTFQMTNYILPNEIFPTRISVWGWSVVCFVGRIGCVMAPFCISFSSSVFLVSLSCMLAVSASMIWLLPETFGTDPDELDEAKPVDKLAASGSTYGSFTPTYKAS